MIIEREKFYRDSEGMIHGPMDRKRTYWCGSPTAPGREWFADGVSVGFRYPDLVEEVPAQASLKV